MEKIDLTNELAKLLNFVSSVAIALRMNSAYSPVSSSNPDKDEDIMWLSDSLHNFDSLARAIETGDSKVIHSAALGLADTFNTYLNPKPNSYPKSDPRDTFKKWEREVSIPYVIRVLKSIAAKTSVEAAPNRE